MMWKVGKEMKAAWIQMDSTRKCGINLKLRDGMRDEKRADLGYKVAMGINLPVVSSPKH